MSLLTNMGDFAERILAWPLITNFARLGMILGIVAMVSNLLLLSRATYWGQQLQANALKLLIMRISEYAFKNSLSLTLAKDLASETQRTTGCPVLSERMIQEAVRTVRETKRRQQIDMDMSHIVTSQQGSFGVTLDSIVTEFDKRALTPNSIAYTNRMYAYTFCVLGLAIGLFLFQFTSTENYANSSSAQVSFWSLLVLQILLAITTVRAYLVWKARTKRIFEDTHLSSPLPASNKYFDIIMYWLAETPTAGILLAPAWEGLLWLVIPPIQGALFVGWLIIQLMHTLGVLDNDARSILSSVSWPLRLLISIAGMFLIINLHTYKWFDTRRLSQRLSSLRRELKIAQFEKLNVTPVMREYLDEARKLWVINGSLYHWELEEFAQESMLKGNLRESGDFYREALEILLASSADYYKDVGRIVMNYADLLVRTNRTSEAMKLQYYARELESTSPTIRDEILRNIQRTI